MVWHEHICSCSTLLSRCGRLRGSRLHRRRRLRPCVSLNGSRQTCRLFRRAPCCCTCCRWRPWLCSGCGRVAGILTSCKVGDSRVWQSFICAVRITLLLLFVLASWGASISHMLGSRLQRRVDWLPWGSCEP